MAALRGTAQITESTIVTALERFFSTESTRDDDTGEPNQKRRRTTKLTGPKPTTPGKDEDGVAILSRIQVDISLSAEYINFPDADTSIEVNITQIQTMRQRQRDIQQQTENARRKIKRRGFSTIRNASSRNQEDGNCMDEHDDSYFISLQATDDKSARLDVELNNANFSDIVKSLDWIKRVGAPRKPNSNFDADTIAWAKTTLRPVMDSNCYRLDAELFWRAGLVAMDVLRGGRTLETRVSLLKHFFPNTEFQQREFMRWSPQNFYGSAHVTSTNEEAPLETQSGQVLCKLYPFQKRAVDWLLRRERVRFENGSLVPTNSAKSPSFVATQDFDDRQYYVSHYLGMIATDPTQTGSALKGGILAEEMGLGKTVEIISLVSLHRRKMNEEAIPDPYSGVEVTPSGATLIITPPHLVDQWLSELGSHAPTLKVHHYTGMPTVTESNKRDVSVEGLLEYDVVLTTYSVLSREIHFAKELKDFGLRYQKQYEARRSPLVQISWWRVCLDEAQMIESGVSQAATVARLIPRVNAWAVSGTPVKKDVEDLFGLLIFLRYDPYARSKKLWSKISLPVFQEIFGDIALRHSKDKIRNELRLPPQKRIAITVPFTAVEEQVYTQLFQEMCEDCGLNVDGSPKTDDYDLEVTVPKMRQWLRRLRQTCLHPQVGGRNRKALGKGNGPLRTVAEVLELMIEQNEASTREEERSLVMAKITKGHIHAYASDEPKRSHRALEVYQTSLETTSTFVQEIRLQLAEEIKRYGEAVNAAPKRATSADGDETEEELKEDSNAAIPNRLTALRLALRASLGLLHMCTFFVATAYYQIKSDENETKPDSPDFHRLEKLETEFYDKAKAIRAEMLQDSHNKAEQMMKRVETRQKTGKLVQIPQVETLKSHGGIENRRILDKMDELEDLLNDQAEQLGSWRQQVIKILLMPLVDSDEQTTGEEYEESTKAQDELYVYLAVLRAIVADRHHVLTGQQNLLVDNEMKDYVKLAKEDPPQGHAPELLLKVMRLRKRFKLGPNDLSLRGVIAEVRSLATSLQGNNTRAQAEAEILEQELKEIQAISSAQVKAVQKLEQELHIFTNTMNLRVEFYRQLQRISDTVAPYKEDLDESLDQGALATQMAAERTSEERLATLKTKHRFLLHLRSESDGEKVRDCVICQSPIEDGVLTVCGHKYCADCIRHWWRVHHTCPICKRRLVPQDFHAITFKPQKMDAQEEQLAPASPEKNGSSSSRANEVRQSSSIYVAMNKSTLDAIKSIDLDGSYGTKIDMIARHLLYLREADPGCKSIIFSQYGDFLDVLEGAFNRFKIGHTSIRDRKGIEKFKRDANVECFLLDAKSDASGLNLVHATHVFLCEPLINTALELQAIARVHRIGQQRPTAVYQYLISDTVEEAIYDISVARRLAHVTRKNKSNESRVDGEVGKSGSVTPLLQENAIDAANSLELQRAPLGQLVRGKEGEVVEKEDLWRCLFSKRIMDEGVSMDLANEVGRHLRAEVAEGRRTDIAIS